MELEGGTGSLDSAFERGEISAKESSGGSELVIGCVVATWVRRVGSVGGEDSSDAAADCVVASECAMRECMSSHASCWSSKSITIHAIAIKTIATTSASTKGS